MEKHDVKAWGSAKTTVLLISAFLKNYSSVWLEQVVHLSPLAVPTATGPTTTRDQVAQSTIILSSLRQKRLLKLRSKFRCDWALHHDFLGLLIKKKTEATETTVVTINTYIMFLVPPNSPEYCDSNSV